MDRSNIFFGEKPGVPEVADARDLKFSRKNIGA